MVALVTGGCSGLGASFTKELLNRGYKVYALYNSSDEAASKMMNEYSRLECIKCDIRDEENVSKIISKIEKIDLVINNAGIAIDNDFNDKTYNEFMEVMSVNVGGMFNIIKYASRKMNNGVIINISSDNSLGNHTRLSIDYDCSKAAVNMLTVNFGDNLDNVKVVAYAPGWINTPSVKEMNPKYLASELARVKQEKLIEPDELVKVILDDVKFQNSGSVIPISEV